MIKQDLNPKLLICDCCKQEKRWCFEMVAGLLWLECTEILVHEALNVKYPYNTTVKSMLK